MSVNKLCALFTISLWSLASQMPFLYVVQWNILDNFLETIYVIYIKLKYWISFCFFCISMFPNMHCLPCVIGHRTRVSFIQCQTFSKVGKEGNGKLAKNTPEGLIQWQPTPVFLPGKSHRPRSLVGYSPWGHKQSDTTERLHFLFF